MNYLKLIIVPVLFALLLRITFGSSIFDNYLSVMTWTFFILVPLGIGALTIYYSSKEKVASINYRVFAPWLPIIIVIGLTILIGLEGWACWIMISPLFYYLAQLAE